MHSTLRSTPTRRWPCALSGGLAALGLLFVMIALAPRAEAAIVIAKDIINVDNGTKLGSLGLPAQTGSSAMGVTLELSVGGQVYDQSEIVSISWDLASVTPSLSLKVDPDPTSSCSSAATDGPCTKTTIHLSLTQLMTTVQSCPAPPPPPLFATCAQFSIVLPIEFVDAAPAYACQGFEPPLADGPVTAKGNRALPLRAELFDQDGVAFTGTDLGAPPVLQVRYQSGIDGTPEDVSDQILWVGQGTAGNAFVFSGSKWRFNLKIGNYTAPGTYTMTMISGNGAEYRVEPICEAQFIVNP